MRRTILIVLMLSITLFAKDYTKNSQTIDFIDMMSQKHSFSKLFLINLFAEVSFQKTPLKLYGGLKNKTKNKKKPIKHG